MTDTLNPAQRAAVEHVDGPLLVLAGAGSGKTRVITHRLAHLIASGQAQPREILSLTFTNKAAAEMRERANVLTSGGADQAILSTFHSACARWLRTYGRRIGLTAGFSILDVDDQLSALKAVTQALGIESQKSDLKQYRHHIERIKQRAWRPDEVAERSVGRHAELISDVYAGYQKELARNNAVDFGDLIARMVHLLHDHEDLREGFRRMYRFVMVDEFQDTNIAQFRLLQMLVPKNGNIVAVGDDDQSIYRWRGASVENVRRFQRYHDQCGLVALEENYRSTAEILDAAHGVVEKLPDRMPKRLRAARGPGKKLRAFVAGDDREEARYVANTIARLRRETGMRYSDMAIFYRTNAQTRIFEDQLRRAGVGYHVVSGLSFFERREIKDLIAYLRLVVNPADDVAFRRVVNVPSRGIGAGTLERLEQWRVEGNFPHLVAAIAASDQMPGRALPARARSGIAKLNQLFADMVLLGQHATVSEIFDTVIEDIGYYKYLETDEPDTAEDRTRNVEELINAAEDFAHEPGLEGVADFLEYASLRQDADQVDERSGSVQMMTVHASKGLEFPVVFVTGLEDDLFPLKRRDEGEDPGHDDEERRLCYVAFTRAKDLLYVSAAQRRRLYGKGQPTRPSPFLTELSPSVVEMLPHSGPRHWRAAPEQPQGRWGKQASFDEFDQRPWQERVPEEGIVFDGTAAASAGASDLVGKRATHKTFGVGTITEVSGSGDRAKLTIRFPKVGVKRVILKYVEVQQ